MTHAPQFHIGSEEEDGSHRPDRAGWPYSIFMHRPYGGDAVLCHGIQNIHDAEQLLAMCNGDLRPALGNQSMFTWEHA